MEKEKKHILIVAGEASGDIHAAHLVDEIKKLDPGITFSGLGGSHLKDSGVEIYHDLTKFAVVGFWEVLKHYGEFKKIFDVILKKAKEIKPACVILVDYPGFNLRLAKKLKQQKIKVIYYISPQVWAWKKSRVHQIKKNVDRMLVIFEFEKNFYKSFGMDVEFVGHPLADQIQVTAEKETVLKSHHLQEYRLTIGILPGSRVKEVQRILPVMLKAAQLLQTKFPMLQFMIIK